MPRFTKGSIEAKQHMAHLRSMRGSGLVASRVRPDDSDLFSPPIQTIPTIVAQPLTPNTRTEIRTEQRRRRRRVRVQPTPTIIPSYDDSSIFSNQPDNISTATAHRVGSQPRDARQYPSASVVETTRTTTQVKPKKVDKVIPRF